MLTSDRFIRAGNIVNEYIRQNELDGDVLEALQILKDGCYEAIQIPRMVRRRFVRGDRRDELSVQDQQ